MAAAVSIIMPTFNRLPFLRVAVESIFNQSFADWELIVADDGSAAETQAYLRTLAASPRIKVLWLEHSGNPPAARNVALAQAAGEYVAFLDSDDVWMPGKLAAQIELFRSHGDVGWNYTRFTLVDDAGDPSTGTRARRFPAAAGWILDALIVGEAVIAQSSVAIRRRLIQRVGGYDATLPVCGDYELWIRLAQQSAVDFIDAPLVHIRRHDQHYSDDVLALEDLRRMLEKVRRSQAAVHLDHVLVRRCAEASAGIAAAHALCRRRRLVLSTIMASAHYSWRYRKWWTGALSAIGRAFAPPVVMRILRQLRNFRRSGGSRA
jgi:glycosyltransferase involved in cell wall biosynthesis